MKSRMQACAPGTYRNWLHCVKTSYQREGAVVFIRGSIPAYLRAFPLHSTVFIVYEYSIRFLDKSFAHQ